MRNNKKEPKSKLITIRITEKIDSLLRKKAIEDGRTLSSQVSHYIDIALKQSRRINHNKNN